MRLFVIHHDVAIVSPRNNILWKNHLTEHVCHHFLLKIILSQIISEMTLIVRIKPKLSNRGDVVI